MSEKLVFDLAPAEEPVEIGGKEYVLCEPSEDAACQFRNALTQGAKLSADGKATSVGNIADAEPLLVSLCLFEVYEDRGEKKRRPTTLIQVRRWPARVVKALFARAQEMGDLTEGAGDVAAKNGQRAEPVTSG